VADPPQDAVAQPRVAGELHRLALGVGPRESTVVYGDERVVAEVYELDVVKSYEGALACLAYTVVVEVQRAQVRRGVERSSEVYRKWRNIINQIKMAKRN